MMKRATVYLVLALALVSAGCAPASQPKPIVLLLSIDGFRADYLDRFSTPNLDRLATRGVRASLIPSFPSKTFPNHWTLVTGLYPEHHGIVANSFYDPDRDARFKAGEEASVRDGAWWAGEPIWITAEKNGILAAPFFWPGCEAPIQGRLARYVVPFQDDMPNSERIDRVLGYLKLPEAERPGLLTLYFSLVDNAGHDFGPDSEELRQAVETADSLVGKLIAGLEDVDLADRVDLLITADHGMAALDPQKVVFLDDFLDLDRVDVVDSSPLAALWPGPDYGEEAWKSLQEVKGATAYRRKETLERLHYRDNPRIPPLMLLADEGGTITTHARFEERDGEIGGGNHGYDNELLSMRALWIAAGPGLKRGVRTDAVENIHIYPLMAHLLGIQPASSDGNLEAVRSWLE